VISLRGIPLQTFWDEMCALVVNRPQEFRRKVAALSNRVLVEVTMNARPHQLLGHWFTWGWLVAWASLSVPQAAPFDMIVLRNGHNPVWLVGVKAIR